MFWKTVTPPDNNKYSGLNLNQDKATKPQTVQIVRQGEATPYWFKVNPLYKYKKTKGRLNQRSDNLCRIFRYNGGNLNRKGKL